MLKTVYSALAVTALLAGTASFAADQTSAPTTPTVAPTAAVASTTTPAVTPAKETVKATTGVKHEAKVVKAKEAAAPSTASSATPTVKK